ncbi:MAG: PhnD/SsuA/transferrin family substrate-binding protein [Candidatus Thermoplasmatota archaeon]|nr:PhnD/SsuA/transferrin family substrate-binding protein [Candidatus Thermoplasmatota archaeon]
MKHPFKFWSAALLLLGAAGLVQAAEQEELYLGSVAMDVPAEMVRRMTPLTEYLTKKTGIKISFRASPNLGSAVNELGKDFTQIAYLTPVAYIEAHDKYRVQPLVSPLTHGKSTFNLVIAVRSDSPYKTMEDLKGRKFAFGDQKALLQRAVVVGAGVKLEDFSNYGFLKHYDNIAKAVLNKDFDGGILKDTIYEEFAPKGLRKIYTSPPLSSYLFAVSDRLPPATVKKLRNAFLELNASNPEHAAVLKELDKGYGGFEPQEDKDYDPTRKLIAPFQQELAK